MAQAKTGRSLVARAVIAMAVLIAVVALVVAVANIATIATTRGQVRTVDTLASEVGGNPVDAVVVLGASVHADGTPSDILADRLEVAVDLYRAGAAKAIICSGDNRSSHYNESDAMKAYCVALGVPSEDVFVDHAGNTTYESMYRARHLFGAERIVVTTQAYHLYRAMFAGQALGMETWGVPSDKGAYDNQLSYSVREVAARTKDFFAALFNAPVAIDETPVSLADSGDRT